MTKYAVLLCAIIALFHPTPASCAETADVRPEPGGKRLLFIDGDDIRREPGGKRILFIDGDTLRDAPGGKRLLFIDGDDIRPAPGGIRILFIDGSDLRRRPGGKRLLFIDGDDIRPEPGGKRLLFIDGKVSKEQLVAALYVLKPELFKLSKEEEATLKAEMKAAATESEKEFSDVLLGKFDVLNSSLPDWAGGTVTTTRGKDGIHYLDLKLKKQSLAGIGIPRGDPGWEELWIAFAPEGAVALAVYEIAKGKLTGKWIPINAAKDGKETYGKEVLEGPADLNGTFKILEAQAPNKGAEYTGTVTISPFKPADGNSSDLSEMYSITWNFGTLKIPGVGAKLKVAGDKSVLIVASGTKGEFAVGHVTCDSATKSKGIDFLSSKHGPGYILWVK
jgi:hypothetical protein